MIIALHAHCDTGSVRDPHALAVVSELGVKNVRLTGCPVLFWAQQPDLPPVRPIPHEDVVITARNWLMHRWPDAVDHPVQIAFLDTVIKNFSSVPWLYALHEDFDESLLSKLGIAERNIFRGSTAEDFIALYRDQKHVVLASRLHGGMLALANGVPAVFVGHDTRTYSFCDLMGLDYVELFSDGAADVATQRLRRILEGDASEFADLNRRFQSLRQEMSLFRRENSLTVEVLI
jgi:polysaccharide pyruvyl transferase WcaK-like protein